MTNTKYRFDIENLDCANCAQKIQDKISSLTYIENATVNFATSKLTFMLKENAPENAVEEIAKIIDEVEPGTKLIINASTPASSGGKRKTVELDGLDCASCAAKIESGISEMEMVESASVNFATSKMTYTLKPDAPENSDKLIANEVSIIETGVRVTEPRVKKTFTIDGLDCANCAAKIEDGINKFDFVELATVNFATASLTYTLKPNAPADADAVIAREVTKIEAGASISTAGAVSEQKSETKKPFKLNQLHRVLIAFAVFLVAVLVPMSAGLQTVLMVASVLITGYHVIVKGLKNLVKFDFEENLLMTVAIIAAFIIGERLEGTMVMLLFTLGEYIESLAVGKSRKDIAALTNIRPDTAELILPDGTSQTVPAEGVNLGDKIILKNGERVPLDCKVMEGSSSIDASAITGESIPVTVTLGDEILSGSINKGGLLTCEVINTFQNSAASRIIELVENSAEKKGKTEDLITKFSRIYTPVVIIAAIILAVVPPLVTQTPFLPWIKNALVFLVASCPCAFVIAVPLGFYSSIGTASQMGVLVKGGKFIEILSKTDIAVFDKTGTLTTGDLSVDKIVSHNNQFTNDDILKIAAHLESYSTHPIATSIVDSFEKAGGLLDLSVVENYEEVPAHGVKAHIDGKEILCGSERMMNANAIDTSQTKNSNIYLAIDGALIGQIFIADEIKESAIDLVKDLKAVGVGRVIMLTGDSQEAADRVARELGITEYYANLLPEDKVTHVEELKKEGTTLFVGDGINDAPVLAMSDIAVAMGLGSDIAIESADVVLMSGNLKDLANAVDVSRRSLKTVYGLIALAIGVKLIVLILAALGLASMLAAVFADVGVTIIAVIIATRIMKYHEKYKVNA